MEYRCGNGSRSRRVLHVAAATSGALALVAPGGGVFAEEAVAPSPSTSAGALVMDQSLDGATGLLVVDSLPPVHGSVPTPPDGSPTTAGDTSSFPLVTGYDGPEREHHPTTLPGGDI